MRVCGLATARGPTRLLAVGEVTDTLDRTVSECDRFSGHTRVAAGGHSATDVENVAKRGSYLMRKEHASIFGSSQRNGYNIVPN